MISHRVQRYLSNELFHIASVIISWCWIFGANLEQKLGVNPLFYWTRSCINALLFLAQMVPIQTLISRLPDPLIFSFFTVPYKNVSRSLKFMHWAEVSIYYYSIGHDRTGGSTEKWSLLLYFLYHIKSIEHKTSSNVKLYSIHVYIVSYKLII